MFDVSMQLTNLGDALRQDHGRGLYRNRHAPAPPFQFCRFAKPAGWSYRAALAIGVWCVRIGVDGFNLAMPHGTGIATYATELVGALHGLGHEVDGVFGLEVPADPTLRQTAFFDCYRRPAEPPRKVPRWRRPWHRARTYLRAFGPHPARAVPLGDGVATAGDGTAAIPPFDRLFSAARLFDDAAFAFARTGRFTTVRLPDPPEVMHWTYPLPISLANARNIYTLHDLVPLKLPYTTLDDKTVYGRLIAGCLRHADQICTVSEASKRDIVDRYAVDPARITNTYQAAPPAAVGDDPAEDARAVESIFGLERRGYFLFFGAIEPKKNVGRLIEAYLTLRSATPLVIVGARAWQSEAELQLMPGDGASGAAGTFHGPRGQKITRLDYLSRPLLAKLVRGAKAVVFPSLYEGFGLPVLEAMQLGTPVITSTTSSLPEVAGDAGLLVDPYDVDALVAALRRLDGDEALGAAMGARGLAQAALFSRARYQERLTDLYRAAMAPR
jgi:glycosyltransferase involved in cell wall biosynthesis